MDLQPTNYKARIDLGNLLLAAGKIDDAQAQANAVMAAQPNNPDVHALLSAIAVRRGQKDQALIEIQRALELDPNRAAFHEDLALLQSGDPTKATSVEEELKKAVALDPKSVNAKLLLAAFYAKNSRWQEAEKRAGMPSPRIPRALPPGKVLPGSFSGRAIRRGPRKCFGRRRKIFPDDPQGVRIAGGLLRRFGQMDKAKAEFASLAAKYPKNISCAEGIRSRASSRSRITEPRKPWLPS